METIAISQFMCGRIASSIPQKEGLYLYIKDYEHVNEDLYDNPQVCVVEVRWYMDTLIADSDSFFTYLPVEMVDKEIPGLWTVKLELSGD